VNSARKSPSIQEEQSLLVAVDHFTEAEQQLGSQQRWGSIICGLGSAIDNFDGGSLLSGHAIRKFQADESTPGDIFQ